MATKTKDNSTKTPPNTPFEATSAQADGYSIAEPDYSQAERDYREYLLKVLEIDRNRREAPHIEFNGLTYTENYRSNMLAANSYTPPRANADDTQVVTGTTREKVLAIVSAILNLNFETVFMAYDKDDLEDENLAEAMTDIVQRANRMELWDDKKLYAYFEMATQGDVYVEEIFVDEMTADKEAMPLSAITKDTMKNYKPSTKNRLTFSGCQRNFIPGTQVFKGSMTERNFRDQPHIFTVEYRPYEVAKSLYGNLPRWENVPRKLVATQGLHQEGTSYGQNWRLDQENTESCEIIKYQDRFNNEYQIIINSTMMLPVGFAMPWGFPEYNIVQGRLEPISAFFSESKSIPAKTKLDQEILDEMYRLAVLKSQKSFMPPIANYSTNILSKAAFAAGKVNNNLQKGDIEVVGGDPGMYAMKPSEFQMIEMIKKFIDEKSVNPILQGQQNGNEASATQINTVTQQAKQQLGLLIFGFIQLHMNLDMLRLYDLLENYTKQTDQKVNAAKDGVIGKYRSVSVNKPIGSKGMGVKQIQFTEEQNSPSELYDMQNGVTRDNAGKPVGDPMPPRRPIRILQINPKVLRSLQYTWYAEVTPVEKETSLSSRIEFTDQLINAQKLFGQQSINADYAQTQWATRQKLDPDLFFNKNPQTQPGLPGPGDGADPEISNMSKQAAPFGSGAGAAEAVRQGMG